MFEVTWCILSLAAFGLYICSIALCKTCLFRVWLNLPFSLFIRFPCYEFQFKNCVHEYCCTKDLGMQQKRTIFGKKILLSSKPDLHVCQSRLQVFLFNCLFFMHCQILFILINRIQQPIKIYMEAHCLEGEHIKIMSI